jgi:hypothetical protein
MTPLDAAHLAQAAYTTPPTIGEPTSAARAVVGNGVVSFPGTNNIACWLADLDAKARFVQGLGWLHCGFMDALEEIKAPLLALPDVDVTVGHSEGAALAILYAAARCLAGCPPKEVYAFEPPRVSADGALAKLFKDNGVKVNLYRNGNDIVPIVPRILHDWQHPAPLINIGEASLPFPNVEDHLMHNVIESLKGPMLQ